MPGHTRRDVLQSAIAAGLAGTGATIVKARTRYNDAGDDSQTVPVKGVTERWRTRLKTDGPPAFSSTGVYVSGDDGRLRALRLTDGTVRWATESLGESISPPLVHHDTVFVAGWKNGRTYHAFDPETGERQWVEKREGPQWPLVGTGNAVVAIGYYATLFDAGTGEERWQSKPLAAGSGGGGRERWDNLRRDR